MRAQLPTGNPTERVALGDVAAPQPRPDQAVIRVAAYSINRGETFQLETDRPGWRPGKDVAGTVVRAAADGSGPAVGVRVVGHPEQAGWAEEVAVATSSLAVVPDAVELTTAAALPLAGLTALRLTRVIGTLAGKRLLLTGASGGVGHYFVELAAAQGALITAISRTPERGKRLLALGAAEVVADIADTTGPYDVIIESVGGDNAQQAWTRLTELGVLIWLGQASRQPITLDYFNWTGGMSATMRKFNYGESDRSFGDDLATLLRLVTQGHLHPEIDRIEDWADTNRVIAALLGREIVGNAVLTIPAR